jgi:hypothetical protein
VDTGSREENAPEQKIRAGSDSIRTDKALVVSSFETLASHAPHQDEVQYP